MMFVLLQSTAAGADYVMCFDDEGCFGLAQCVIPGLISVCREVSYLGTPMITPCPVPSGVCEDEQPCVGVGWCDTGFENFPPVPTSCATAVNCSVNADCGQHLLCVDGICTAAGSLTRSDAPSASLRAGRVLGLGCDIAVEGVPGAEEGSNQFDAALTDLFELVGNLSITGFSDPSICYNLDLINPTDEPRSLAVTFTMPTVAVDLPYYVNTNLWMDLTDGSGDQEATVETSFNFLRLDGLDSGGFVTAIGVATGADLGETTTGIGRYSFGAGPVAGIAPARAGFPIERLRLVIELTLSAGDSVHLQGHAFIDTGSGAPSCFVPPLALPLLCGDPERELGRITATDALSVLRTAVTGGGCRRCVCDVDDSGAIVASDALAVLQEAVGKEIELTCPACDTAGP